jgi:hypothetical protein
VGAGYTITFTEGWQQEWDLNFVRQLWLDGVGDEATIAGDSTIGGIVRVDGIGRFTSDVNYSTSGELHLDIAGPIAGTGYDQLIVVGDVSLAGALRVTFEPAFVPDPGDEFVALQYGSHSGFFEQVLVSNLDEDFELVPLYGTNELVLLVHLVGDVDGDGQLGPKDIPALNMQLGPCPPEPEHCPADLDGDGDVDVQDRLILIGLIKEAKKAAKGK